MSNILVCLIFQRALFGVLMDDLADGPLFAVLEPFEDLRPPLVDDVRLVVPVDHIHDLAADTGAHFGEANLKSADMAAGIAAVPLLQFEGGDTWCVNMVGGPAHAAEAYREGLSEE